MLLIKIYNFKISKIYIIKFFIKIIDESKKNNFYFELNLIIIIFN